MFIDFAKSLGLPGFDPLKEVLGLNLFQIKLEQVLEFIDGKEKILKLLEKVDVGINEIY